MLEAHRQQSDAIGHNRVQPERLAGTRDGRHAGQHVVVADQRARCRSQADLAAVAQNPLGTRAVRSVAQQPLGVQPIEGVINEIPEGTTHF